MGTTAVGFDPRQNQLTAKDYACASAFAAVATRATCQPFDVLKIRLQLQVESRSTAKYRSLLDCCGVISREEGVRAFWKGHAPAQLLSLFYGVGQFGAVEALTKSLYGVFPWTAEPRAKPLVHMVCGGAGGAAGTLLSFPFDVLRTRLVAQGGTSAGRPPAADRRYDGWVDAVRKMLRTEGPFAFYKGLVPTFAAIVPYSGFQFGFYTLFAELLGPRAAVDGGDAARISMSASLSCGALAGLGAKTLIYPLDTVKKRLQVQGFGGGRSNMGETRAYGGMRDCFRKVLAQEGVSGLYKGCVPGLLKAVATTAVNFAFYEYACRALAASAANDRDDAADEA